MEIYILLLILFFVISYAMIRGALEERQYKKAYREKLKNRYGTFENREYTQEDWNNIKSLFVREQNESEEYFLDDITWSDLSMNQIFELMNHTQSASGAEYLYAMLRKPNLKQQDMADLEKHILYYMEHEDERLDLQMILHELGNTGKYSLFDYIDFLGTIEKCKSTKHYICLMLLVLSVILLFCLTNIGIVLFIVTACYNVVSYMTEKRTVLPYVTTFAYISRMIKCAKKTQELPLEELLNHKEKLKKDTDALAFLTKKTGMISRMNVSTGNPFDIVYEYIKMLTHIDLIQFNKILNKVCENKSEIEKMTKDMGYLDAVVAIGAFRAALPYWCEPHFSVDIDSEFCIKDGFHPMLSNPVPNSFRQKRGMLITGSNASGKSTFLKMTAINAILAQTIHTCTASEYYAPMFRIYSSMSLRDNLNQGESYYIVEIKALKRIIDSIGNHLENPLLCFVDEVLRGTNTVERIAASTQIMKRLSQKGVYCFAATHDIELTHLLEKYYDNYHFEEEVKSGDILFSYHLLLDRAHTRNAIKLLEVIGFEESIINEADCMAANFLKTGEWK